VDQNTSLKKEAGIAERKLLARNERIQNLEALLQDADRRLAVQNQKFEAQLQAVKERLDQARGNETSPDLGRPMCSSLRQPRRPRQHPPCPSPAELPSLCAAEVSRFGHVHCRPLRLQALGGNPTPTTTAPSPIQGGSANPLARVQGEEPRYVGFLPISDVIHWFSDAGPRPEFQW
jgi:hypothetical protein